MVWLIFFNFSSSLRPFITDQNCQDPCQRILPTYFLNLGLYESTVWRRGGGSAGATLRCRLSTCFICACMRKSQNTFRDTLSSVSCPPISFCKTQLSSTLLSLSERASLVESSHISNFQKHSVIFDGLFFHFLLWLWIMELHFSGGLYLYAVFCLK